MFCSGDVSFNVEYLGVMVKLGLFCRRDNCSTVRGVLERSITHLSMWLVHVWLWLVLPLGGGPGAESVATAWVEGVGVLGVAGTLEVVEAVVELVVNWMAHYLLFII